MSAVARYRAALRIARREAWRARGRSALVVAMVALPMAAAAYTAVALRTAQIPAAERERRAMGRADVVLAAVSGGPITQDGERWDPVGEPRLATQEPDVGALLPAGSRVAVRDHQLIAALVHDHRAARISTEAFDFGDPLNDGLVRRKSGAYPRGADECALSPKLAHTVAAGVGDEVALQDQDGRTELTCRVSGIVADPSDLTTMTAYVTPRPFGHTGFHTRAFAVALPAGVDPLSLREKANAAGVLVSPRRWVNHPPGGEPVEKERVRAYDRGVALVVGGLAVLEVILLAATAFAVGARRRRRELALVAATGGDRRDVRRVVLWGGGLLGAVAGGAGVLGGAAGVALSRPFLDRVAGYEVGPYRADLRVLLGVVVLGAGTALVAALLPARAAARQSVVAALTGRPAEPRRRRRRLVMPVLALLVAAGGAWLAYHAAGTGYVVGDPMGLTVERETNFPLMLAGAAAVQLAFVALTPALVDLVGRLARLLPLAPRLAVRDAARHRARSAPAVAAVAAAVAGSITVSVYLASQDAYDQRAFRPSVPIGTTTVSWGRGVTDATVKEAATRLPVRLRIDFGTVVVPGCKGGDDLPCGWGIRTDKNMSHVLGRPDPPGMKTVIGELSVAGEDAVRWLAQDHADEAVAAYRAGRAVVFDDRLLTKGTLDIQRVSFGFEKEPVPETVRHLPALYVHSAYAEGAEIPSVVMAPETARRYGLEPGPTRSTVLVTRRAPSAREEAAALDALPPSPDYPMLYVARKFASQNPFALVALAFVAAVVTVGATAIATGLAAADSRPDLATLAAVGAGTGVRRRLAMAQAGTVAVLGTGVGLMAGIVPAMAIVRSRRNLVLTLPGRQLLLTVVGVPVLAAIAVGVSTRSRLPLERRVT